MYGTKLCSLKIYSRCDWLKYLKKLIFKILVKEILTKNKYSLKNKIQTWSETKNLTKPFIYSFKHVKIASNS